MADTFEQLVRDVLAQAIADGLVAPRDSGRDDSDPQSFTGGDLVGVANLLESRCSLKQQKQQLEHDDE